MSVRIGKLLRVLVIILLVLLILFPVAMISAGIIVVANEEKLLRINLDNMYINSGYVGWKSAEIADWDPFLIPNSWNIASEFSNYQFYDADGDLIAYCTILGDDNSQYSDYEAFITSRSEEEILNITDQYVPGFVTIDYSNYSSLVVEYSNSKEVYHYLSLRNSLLPELFIVFPPDSSVDEDVLIDIAQAIAYSYEYPDP